MPLKPDCVYTMFMNPEGMLSFYRAFRAACAPPMVQIASIDIGELWFYWGMGVAITACLGEQSLLVAYDTCKPREDVIAHFRAAHEWLQGRRPDAPEGLYLVFAAREDAVRGLVVQRASFGDWAGIPANVPLPPTKPPPPGWVGSSDDPAPTG